MFSVCAKSRLKITRTGNRNSLTYLFTVLLETPKYSPMEFSPSVPINIFCDRGGLFFFNFHLRVSVPIGARTFPLWRTTVSKPFFPMSTITAIYIFFGVTYSNFKMIAVHANFFYLFLLSHRLIHPFFTCPVPGSIHFFFFSTICFLVFASAGLKWCTPI